MVVVPPPIVGVGVVLIGRRTEGPWLVFTFLLFYASPSQAQRQRNLAARRINMSEIPQVECPAWASILGALGIALAVGLTGICDIYDMVYLCKW